MPEVKREDLIKAAKELNDVLGLDPQIKTGKKVTDKELTEQILEAADLLLPEDDISEETMGIIKLLKGESVEEEDEEVEVDEDLEDEEEEELEEDTEVEELEEVEEDEDSETEEEVKDEVDEKKTKSKTKKGKKVEKEQKVKKDTKSNKQKKENASENDRSKSNKAIVYEAWKSNNITDIKKLAARVNNEVKESTIKIWIAQWKKGKNLPAIARKKDDK